jgi:hypothetical protein
MNVGALGRTGSAASRANRTISDVERARAIARTPKVRSSSANARASVLIQVKTAWAEAEGARALSTNKPSLFTTSLGCRYCASGPDNRDTTRAEISRPDDPAECQFAAEWDFLNACFASRRIAPAFIGADFGSSRWHRTPSLFEWNSEPIRLVGAIGHGRSGRLRREQI